MAKTFDYKKTTATTMKLVGVIDTDAGTIDIDGMDVDLVKMLSDFNGACVTITAKTTTEEEFDVPSAVGTDDLTDDYE